MTLTMCIGLPASGKTTWAKEQLSAVRVNKDEIRAYLALGGWTWSEENEKQVVEIRDYRIEDALSHGSDVISDDTNFAPVHRNRLKELAAKHDAAFVEKFFPIDIEEAIRRDSLREGTARVGEEVIRRMAKQHLSPVVVPYVHTKGLRMIVMCDLDGTAAIITGRSPYDGGNCHLDKVNEAVLAVVVCLDRVLYPIIYMSGRDDAHKDVTRTWLKEHRFPDGELHMRKTGDKRKDFIVKGELFDEHIRGKYNVLLVLDDRTSVVNYWRSLGLACWQVNPGDF